MGAVASATAVSAAATTATAPGATEGEDGN